ncbi:cyclic nucleotide-binding domain-containing protein [Sulfitobacter sp. JL08]|uniref:cyclic nucleotide-binding domain-containing protein n=1 Tax=Sulfitobacter sp. JL08 TaxID=2070369 RepID=UPI000E0A72DE|nr:cyclic nucleotide-binding domain-containing protein [Sulfitobacter sp. JL08]
MPKIRSFTAPQGKIIFQPGHSCPGFIVLSNGSIKVTLTGASGREVVLYRVRPGEACLQTLSCLRAALRSHQRQWIAARNANCEQLFSSSMDFMSTRDAALCLYGYNEDRIYSLIDNPLFIQR